MPIAPFIYGVIVGSAVTYVIKDKPSQEKLKNATGKAAVGLTALTGKVTSLFKKDEVETSAKAEEKDAAAA
ncbi:MAG TPA: hypothetical protein ENJ84_08935 [Gammaproteobacteria bacterium]|nr:hypothetical protein [Gammaproteobacteria bacterium]